MELIFTDKHISIYTKRIALEFYIEPILMNRYEAWTITKQVQRDWRQWEMWLQRRLLRDSWTGKNSTTNSIKTESR